MALAVFIADPGPILFRQKRIGFDGRLFDCYKFRTMATGVRGRNSDNRLIEEKLGWSPSESLKAGLEKTYEWIERQVMRNAA